MGIIQNLLSRLTASLQAKLEAGASQIIEAYPRTNAQLLIAMEMVPASLARRIEAFCR